MSVVLMCAHPQEDVLKALEDSKPSVDQVDLEKMQRFTEEMQRTLQPV